MPKIKQDENVPASTVCFVTEYKIGYSHSDEDGTFFMIRFYGVNGKHVDVAMLPDAAVEFTKDLDALRKEKSQ